MTVYQNNEHGFELTLPTGWSTSKGLSRLPFYLAITLNQADILEEFTLANQEFLNIVVEKMIPELPPDVNDQLLILQARNMGYSDLILGKFEADGHLHSCGSYVIGSKGWAKKYLIVLNGVGIALTASCQLSHRTAKIEDSWDAIAKSVRLIRPLDQKIVALNKSLQSRRTIDEIRAMLKIQLGD